MRNILKNHTSALVVASALLLASTSPVVASSSNEDPDELSGDSTSVTSDTINSLNYSLPNASYADEGAHATTADLADLATNAIDADNATNAVNAVNATLADTATNADLADNALALAGNDASYYTNASNISSGTLDLDRLIGSVVDGSGNIRSSLLDSGTYAINISGNASSATSANYASTAGSANSCTGGASSCDF